MADAIQRHTTSPIFMNVMKCLLQTWTLEYLCKYRSWPHIVNGLRQFNLKLLINLEKIKAYKAYSASVRLANSY